MFGFHFPALDHVAEFCDAVINKILLVLVPVADNLPEVISGALLKNGVFCEFSKLTDDLEFFEANLVRLDQDKLVIEVVNVLLFQPNSDLIDNFVDFETILSGQRPE